MPQCRAISGQAGGHFDAEIVKRVRKCRICTAAHPEHAELKNTGILRKKMGGASLRTSGRWHRTPDLVRLKCSMHRKCQHTSFI